jgi:hypothetical protein
MLLGLSFHTDAHGNTRRMPKNPKIKQAFKKFALALDKKLL